MQTPEEIIEKYKNDMLNMMKRSYYPYEEALPTVARADEEVKNTPTVDETPTEKAVSTSFEEGTGDAEDSGERFGSLKVRAFGGNIAYPIETAFVRLFDSKGKPISEGYTNQSGILDFPELPTPDKSISESPNGEKGYATYKIIVTHPRFNTEIFENVPVFEGIESIQDVRMEIGSSDNESLTVESEPEQLGRYKDAE